MTLSVPPGYAHIIHSIRLVNDNEPMAITYGVKLATATDTGTEVDTMVATINTHLGSDVVPGWTNDYSLVQTEAKYLFASDSLGDPLRVAIDVNTYVGASTDPALPSNCAALVHKRTATGGRRGRGRLYSPALAEGSVSATGGLSTLYQGELQSAWDTFLSDLQGTSSIDGGMWLLHSTNPPSGIIDPALLPPPDEVIALAVDGTIATQRRRMRP